MAELEARLDGDLDLDLKVQLCDLGRQRGEDDVPPRVIHYCQDLVHSLRRTIHALPDGRDVLAWAQEVALRGSELRDRRHDSLQVALARVEAAETFLLLGQTEQATPLLQRALPVLREASRDSGDWHLLADYGRALRLSGDTAAARAIMEQALDVAATSDKNDDVLMDVIYPLGHLLIESGDEAGLERLMATTVKLSRTRNREWVPSGFGWESVLDDRAVCRGTLLDLMMSNSSPQHSRWLEGLHSYALACLMILGEYEGAAALVRLPLVLGGREDEAVERYLDSLVGHQKKQDPDVHLWRRTLMPDAWVGIPWAREARSDRLFPILQFSYGLQLLGETLARRERERFRFRDRWLVAVEAVAVLKLHPKFRRGGMCTDLGDALETIESARAMDEGDDFPVDPAWIEAIAADTGLPRC